jgi:hypothetical protein
MGTKFAHFSILGGEVDEAIALLQPPRPRRDPIKFAEALFPGTGAATEMKALLTSDNKDIQRIMQYMTSGQTEYYVGQNHGWVTVYSEEFTFETIDKYVLGLSRNSPRTFLTISMYDCDVCIITIISEGKILTRHISGYVATTGWAGESSDMNDTLGDVKIIARTFGIQNTEKLEQILNLKDQDEKLGQLQEISHMGIFFNDGEALLEHGWKKVMA